MNLIKDTWIPARRADGTVCDIAPWEIGASENPVVEISAPRPDFRGALFQFLIGLVQTAFAPEDDDKWEEKWNKIPTCGELKIACEKFADAFELENKGGPAFMQDINLPEKAEESEIRALLIDAPGNNTIKNNLDHFVKRDSINGLCDACVATAIIGLQINAPSGGQGHRTGMRGGGPLTTLVLPEKRQNGLWGLIWLNVLSLEERFGKIPDKPDANVFPWLGETRESSKDKETFPEQVDELQMYWATPRRIRLEGKCESGVCDGCGHRKPLWISFRAVNYGVSYASTWQHSLSPYRKQKEKNGNISLIATKGKQGGFSYPDWLSLTLGNDQNETAAWVVRSFFERKVFKAGGVDNHRLWCCGYDMDNMKARCWYDQTMPLLVMPEEKCQTFVAIIRKLVVAAEDVGKLLRDKIKDAWFARPKDAKGDTWFILSAFLEETETSFFIIAAMLREAIEAGHPTASNLAEWRKIIIDSAERLFDRFALQETEEIKNMKRIAEAAKALTSILNSPKTKSIQALKEV